MHKKTAISKRPTLIAISAVSALFVLLLGISTVYAAVPRLLSFQGRLTDGSGNLLGSTGTNYFFKFAIYNASTGGTKLWPSGTIPAITIKVTQGVFNTLLGDTTVGFDALDLDFDNANYYLEVQTSSNGTDYETLTPRQRIVASGYAVNAETVHGGRFLNALGVGQFGGLSTASYSRFGTAVTSHGLSLPLGVISTNPGALITGTHFLVGSASLNELRVLKIVADEIETPALEFIDNQLIILANNVNTLNRQMSLISGQLAVLGSGSFNPNNDLILHAGLNVDGLTILNGGLIVNRIGSSGDLVLWNSDVEFFGRPYFNSDTGGFAVVTKGSTYASVSFEREYLNQPVVNVTISLNAASASELDEQTLLNGDFRFIVSRKSTTGFVIKLNKPAPFDVQFSWVAVAVKDAKTFFSPLLLSPSATVSIEAANPSPSPSPTSPILSPSLIPSPTGSQPSQSFDGQAESPQPSPETTEDTAVSTPSPTVEPTSEPSVAPSPEVIASPSPVAIPESSPEPTLAPALESTPESTPEVSEVSTEPTP